MKIRFGAVILMLLTSSGCFLKPSNKESLHAFVMLNIGLLEQRDNLALKNESMLSEFANRAMTDPKNKQSYDHAVDVSQKAKEINDYILQLKLEIIEFTDGVDEKQAQERESNPYMVKRKGDYDRPTHVMGTFSPPGNTGKAGELRTKLTQYRAFLLDHVKEQDKKNVEKDLSILDIKDIEDKESGTWEMFHFYHLPHSAILAELTRWQVIVREVESVMLNYLKSGSTPNTMKFDAIEATIVPDSTVITAGSTFEADVFLSAYSTNSNLKITYGSEVDEETGNVVGGTVLNENQFRNGKGHISIPVSGLGERTLGGTITIVNSVTGEEMFYPFKTKYLVISKKTRGQFRQN